MINVLDLAFIGLTILFTIWNIVTLLRYASYRRLAFYRGAHLAARAAVVLQHLSRDRFSSW